MKWNSFHLKRCDQLTVTKCLTKCRKISKNVDLLSNMPLIFGIRGVSHVYMSLD